MRGNSLLMLGLAVVFGLGAVIVTKYWLDTQRSQVVPRAEATLSPTDTVLVAATPMRFGDKIQPENLKRIPWPSGVTPSGAFTDEDALLADGERYVITAIEANEPILEWKITGAGQRATLSAIVEEGKKAVTIRVNDVLGVAGFVLPGDRVDILLTREDKRADDDARKAFTDVLLQNVKVLATDQQADDRRDDPLVAKAVTLEVDTEQAQKLTLAANIGQLSLALRNVVSAQGEVTRRVTVGDLSLGNEVDPDSTELEADTSPRPVFATVGVTRSLKRSEYHVRKEK
ncbi:Flp pilus assembly protein CpaB [Rhizobiales bacterium]|uniref:Flp pilus assembly protein CpaB n=1 Tax=Hongsoonwoonella zoysiae TaxID=2821844 RepID=UPI0015616BC5|nr:Flp pilus assembly protein CpaB [Hongsoonwoonella zoysiae]NRG18516.1 Flp pilus assembly protein CpaB [Hongsoonwoonella zoysiae]